MALEPFERPTAWRLTRCLVCGCEAHYRLEYTIQKNGEGEATCRACHWRAWAAGYRGIPGVSRSQETTSEVARTHAAENGYEYLGPLTVPSLLDDPHRVKCQHCGRISAKRLGDVGWGCDCMTNLRRDRQTSNVNGPPAKKNLLKDSGLPVAGTWDHARNDSALWATVTVKARREVFWKCPDCGYSFSAQVNDRTSGFASCPPSEARRRAEYDRLTRTPVSAVPALLAVWADSADPSTVMVTEGQRRLQCPNGHNPRMSPYRYLTMGCPSCRGNETRAARLEEAAVSGPSMNREIASQWHPTKNGGTKIETVSPNSRRAFWWIDECGHEWQSTPAEREKGRRLRCPACQSILDSLAFHYPEIAAEWSPSNPITAWQVRPSGQTAFVPEWICANGHKWSAALTSRAAGSGCPECRESGKSKVELDHWMATEAQFGSASSGRAITSEAFIRRARWLVDITTELPDGTPIAIEYDGAYWHADKIEIDTAKSLDLLASGYLVARLRESPLPPLPVDDPRYAEFTVHSVAPDAAAAIKKVWDWAGSSRERPASR